MYCTVEKGTEKNTHREDKPWNVHLHLLQPFIFFFLLPSVALVCTRLCVYTWAKAQAWTHRTRESKGVCPVQQIIHYFLSDNPCGVVQCVTASALFM